MSTRTADDGAPRRAPQARLAVQLLIGAVLLLVVWRLRDVALISFGAIIAAALLRGLAAPLARHTRLSARLAIVIVIVALTALLLAALWLTGQPMLQQLQELRNTVPRAWETALRWLQAQPFGPQLLTWLDSAGARVRLLDDVNLAIAMDTADGLFVPVLRAAQSKGTRELRAELDRLKKAARERTLTPEEMQGHTISLSNFGTLAGRYATPVIVPPAVAILGTGKVRRDVLPARRGSGVEVRRRLPLSLTFDHRCITGGEACRFLAAIIASLEENE